MTTHELLTIDPRRALRKLPKDTPLLDRALLRATEDEEGCWIFGGTLTKGYGYVRARVLGSGYAHHVTFDALRGDPRKGLWTDHLCRKPACCNPWHLELVPPGENTRRGVWANGHPRATHCAAGHCYAKTGFYQPPNGRRRCRICQDGIIQRASLKRKVTRKLAKDMRRALVG